MRVAIVGFGIEGNSAYTYWHKLGADITICDLDLNKVVPAGATTHLGPDYLHGLDQFDLIVRTAGIHPEILLTDNPGIEDKMTTVIDEFFRVCPTKNIVGVTGTKGKGTTSTLITRMLQASGEHVLWGGNIGVPPLDFIAEVTPESWVVLELSSFQLHDVHHSPHIGVCLMVVPEHLNWHQDMDEYILSKAHMFEYQTPADYAIYFAENDLSRKIAAYSHGLKIPYFAEPGAYVDGNTITIAGQTICQVDELKLIGEHNWQNVCAAVTVLWQITQNVQAIRSVLTSFSGLEHRLEFVREVNNIKYYDDSFGTTPETAIVAIKAFEEPKVIILGGSDKGVSFDELAQTIYTHNVRHVVLIGETAPLIEAALKPLGYTAMSQGGNTMQEMVVAAQRVAQPGDVVLLSPACASFGLFTNYKERGNQFKTIIQTL